MDAVQHFLSPSEHVLLRTRAHGAMLAGAFLRAGLSLAALAGVVWVTSRAGFAGEGDWLALGAAGVLVVTQLLRLLRRVWEWDRTQLAVTEQQLVVVRGAAHRSTETVPLAAVEHLHVRQSVAGRVFGYGTIHLSSGRRKNGLAYVPRPERISALISVHAGRRSAPERVSAPGRAA
jgi:membrane protein YdbS with pleckstrin-like domain